MSIKTLQLMNFDKDCKDALNKVSAAIATLNSAGSVVLKQQAYGRNNPDDNDAGEILSKYSTSVAAVAVQFNEVQDKLNDVIAVMQGSMTVEDSVAKHNINLVEYSEQLK